MLTMTRPHWFLVIALFLAPLFALLPARVRAQTELPLTVTVAVGLDGQAKEAHWVPLRVTAQNDGPNLAATFSVRVESYNGAATTFERALELPTRSRKEFFLYVRPEGSARRLTVVVREGARVVTQVEGQLTQWSRDDWLIGVLAETPSAFAPLADLDPPNGRARTVQLEPAALPDAGRALESLDALVISGVDTGAWSAGQRQALTDWVTGGGNLLVAGGPNWQRTAAGLESLLPLRPSGSRTLAGLSALTGLAGESGTLGGPAVVATGELAANAVVLAEQDGLPLVVEGTLGAGRVIYLAADHALAPLAGWNGAEGLYRALLLRTAPRPAWSGGDENVYAARQAAEAVPGVGFPSGLLVCRFLGLYVLLVGPVNYVVLKRFKRRELAWITIPALVLVFSAGAYWVGAPSNGGRAGGREPTLLRLAVVQVWPDSARARVDGMVSVYSPRRATYRLALGPEMLAWPLSPGGAAQPPHTLVQAAAADSGTQAAFRVEIGSVQSLWVEGYVPAPGVSADLTYDLSGSSGRLSGEIVNEDDFALQGAALLVAGSLEPLGTLSPGETRKINVTLANRPAGPVLGLPSGFNQSNDSVLAALAGDDVYSDRNRFRRYSLASAVVGTRLGPAAVLNGVYLVGWSDRPLFSASLNTPRAVEVSDTLIVVSLSPRPAVSGATITVPPALFTWQVLDSGNAPSGISPYGYYLYSGGYTLSFRPALSLPGASVRSLTLHLTDSSGMTGPTSLLVDLWNFRAGAWQSPGTVNWGDTALPNPPRFLGPDGEIRLRLQLGSQTPVSIERSDFTLVVEGEWETSNFKRQTSNVKRET